MLNLGRNIADNATKYNFTMTNCTIRGCYAVAGAAVYFNGNDWHNATMNNVTIYGCYCDGDEVTEGVRPSNGIIRSNGGTRTNLTVRNCHFYNNKCVLASGVISWYASGKAEASALTVENCEFYGNEGNSGGAISCASTMNLVSADIHDNITNYGGGVSVNTYTGQMDIFSGKAANVVIGSGVKIHHNTARNYGGGLYYRILKSDDIGFNPSGNPIDVEFKVVINGGQIYNNTAPKGGGIAILDNAPNKQKTRIHISRMGRRQILHIANGVVCINALSLCRVVRSITIQRTMEQLANMVQVCSSVNT